MCATRPTTVISSPRGKPMVKPCHWQRYHNIITNFHRISRYKKIPVFERYGGCSLLYCLLLSGVFIDTSSCHWCTRSVSLRHGDLWLLRLGCCSCSCCTVVCLSVTTYHTHWQVITLCIVGDAGESIERQRSFSLELTVITVDNTAEDFNTFSCILPTNGLAALSC